MKDIIKAMRVLAENAAQCANEIDNVLHDEHDKLTPNDESMINAAQVIGYIGEILSKSADRLEADQEDDDAYRAEKP